MSATQLAPSTTDITTDDELDHITCCVDENISLCGLDLTDVPWVDDFTNLCRMCAELDDVPDDTPEDEPCRACPHTCPRGTP